ncbi:MAG: hypothetical protein E7662_01290 [Ruminococcaceae bacterium]|nr:hypothetical protein [Oscillospiraceae bacterium]
MRKYSYRDKEIKPVVEIYHDVIPYLGGITEGEFYKDTDKCISAWRSANEQIAAYFGDLLAPRAPSAPPLSYGHLVSLGVPFHQPEDAEPNVQHCVNSIDEGIAFLEERKNIDFGAAPECRRYIEMNAAIQEAFPQYKIAPLAGYGLEGVITTAELLRGQDFFCDLYDDPDKVHTFLTLLNESIIDFKKFCNRVNGVAEVSKVSVGIADDFASLIPPDMWSEFVIPYWVRYFEALSTGKSRSVHCENTHPAQLKYLKDAGVTHYQPSVADALTIENVKANTDIPFDWLLYAYRIVDMTDEEIQAWVDYAVESGITKIRTQFGKYAWSIGKMDRILAFYNAFEKYSVE